VSAVGFNDLWVADLAATNGRQLKSYTITASPETISLTNVIKPCEQLAVPLKIVCTARAGATLDLTGTDAWGVAQTELAIDISSGTVTSAKRFASIDANGVTVTGLSVGDSFVLNQDRWGVVWKGNSTQFILDCKITNGSYGNTTWFKDTGKQVTWLAGIITGSGQVLFGNSNSRGNMRFGTIIDAATKASKDGCQFIDLNTGTFHYMFQAGGNTVGIAPTFDILSCEVYSPYTDICAFNPALSTQLVWNTNLYGQYLRGTADWYNITAAQSATGRLFYSSSGTLNKINFGYGGFLMDCYGGTNTLSNVVATGIQDKLFVNQNATITIINSTSNNWLVFWYPSQTTGIVYRQYTLDLQINDLVNSPISGASVKIYDKNSNLLVDTTTDANGNIAQQTLTYQSGVDSNPPHTGNWNYTTTWITLSPHTIVIAKSGYQTITTVFTLDTQYVGKKSMNPTVDIFVDVAGGNIAHNLNEENPINEEIFVP
jgi:hypothetical protein